MRRMLLSVMCVAAVTAWSTAAYAANCKGCEVIKKEGQGFCDHCAKGKIYGLKVASRKLYDALAGDSTELKKVKNSPCPGCKKAAKGGACEHCKVFVAGNRVYHSKTAYALARGEKNDLSAMKCKRCIDAAKHNGTCKHCNTRFVADRHYGSKTLQEAALKAYETVKAAVKDASHCEACALARVTDGKCEQCKVAFKHGKPIS